jgi:hypothetical protein
LGFIIIIINRLQTVRVYSRPRAAFGIGKFLRDQGDWPWKHNPVRGFLLAVPFCTPTIAPHNGGGGQTAMSWVSPNFSLDFPDLCLDFPSAK